MRKGFKPIPFNLNYKSHPLPLPLLHCHPFHSSTIKMAPKPILLTPEQLEASKIKISSHESAFREGSATIVLPSKEAAFLNPVQQFNRDISALAIRTWSQRDDDQRRVKWQEKVDRKAAKGKGKGKSGLVNGNGNGNKRVKIDEEEKEKEGDVKMVDEKDIREVEAEKEMNGEGEQGVGGTTSQQPPQPVWRTHKFTLFEALSATGLRSIRYANEIPLLRSILANDISATAVEAMKRNVALNFPSNGQPIEEWTPEQEEVTQEDGEGGSSSATTSMKPIDEEEMMELENQASTSTSAPPPNISSTASPKSNEFPQDEAPQVEVTETNETDSRSTSSVSTPKIHPECKIKISQDDATSILYSHRTPSTRFDVIDLDPYGTAVPFLDGALQAVSDNGLLCVTCTDLAILAGHNYPEKSFSSYGGVSVKAEFTHEVALRLLLHSIEMTAARYGRTIKPVLSLSIDFYVRIFLIVKTSPMEVKNCAARNGVVYVCSGCGDFREQRFGKVIERENEKDGKVNKNLKYSSAVGEEVPEKCVQCESRYHLAGPLYLGPLHDKSFCDNMIDNLEKDPKRFGTAGRIRGMVGLAADELDTLFYFTPTKLAGVFHCTCPSIAQVVSAILQAGYQASRSHCVAGSIKTTAPKSFIYDLFRRFIALPGNAVHLDKLSPNSPSHRINLKEAVHEVKIGPGVEEHPDTKKVINGSGSGTRYQMNPLPHWGPGTAARGHTGVAPGKEKRKREKEGKGGE